MYEPTNWAKGDVITSAKLNKLENGVADSSVFYVGIDAEKSTNETLVLDKTAGEIYEAYETGRVVMLRHEEDGLHSLDYLYGVGYTEEDGYRFVFGTIGATADTAEDYPEYDLSEQPIPSDVV